MDRLDEFRAVIRSILTEHTRVPIANGEMKCVTVFDRESDRYLALIVSWDHEGRLADAPIAHVDVLDGNLWVQYDGTEYGIAQELIDAGVPEDRIVLGFLPPDLRPKPEGAAA
jgi:hypothetical protein